MSWKSALKKSTAPAVQFARPKFTPFKVDNTHLVTVDFETYFDADYTLRKLSTSEYVRDPRFKIQMVGIKIGNRPVKIYDGKKGTAALKAIDWKTHDLLCHHTQFDGFIMSHHMGIQPRMSFDTLSMARGLHSNEVSGDLDSVAKFYGGEGKVEGFLEKTKGVLNWSPVLFKEGGIYCGQDINECHRIFYEMVPQMPAEEMELIDLIIKMFCDPVLKVNIPRVEAEYARELERREKLLFTAANPVDYDIGGMYYNAEFHKKTLLKGPAERALEGPERLMQIAKRLIGNNEFFADQLRKLDITPPRKISPAWKKMSSDEKIANIEDKWAYAFAKDDLDFINLPENFEAWKGMLDPNKKGDVLHIAAKRMRIENLVQARLTVKSTGNITRAERFLEAGKDGMRLPVGYAYSRAHTHRLGGSNKMNMQNLTRGGELRQSIEAPDGYEICVADSGQIEARTNGWLWGQDDLMEAFRKADLNPKGPDAYTNFATAIYNRLITKDDKTERFVGKVCLAGDTRVFTNNGLKSIVDVKITDLVWDGESWVQHEGLIDQGIKEVHRRHGLAATADHEILTEHGWLAWSAVHTDLSRFRSALSSASSPSSDGNITPRRKANSGAIGLFAGALAALKTWSTSAASNKGVQHDATPAQRSRQAPNGGGSIRTPWPTMSTALACSTACLPLSLDATTQTTQATSITGYARFASTPSGWQTVLSFFGTFKHFPDGTTPLWRWIGGTLTGITSRATSDSLQKAVTLKTSAALKISNNESENFKRKTRTFDLVNAGPKQRFTVLTDHGPVIVHNCVLGLGYQMGAPKLQMTLAKGALGGPPVFFDFQTCQRIVNTYRTKNRRITEGWAKCAEIIEDMAAGRQGTYKCLAWEKDTLWLPNGMSLKYPDLRKARNEDTGWDEWTYQAGDFRSKIYGGLLCENIVQALARIIVMSQMLVINRKYRAVMTTHDEVAALAKKAQAPKCVDFMISTMRTPLAWCLDLPLNAEGGHAPNYSK